jgi:hypothetical protein
MTSYHHMQEDVPVYPFKNNDGAFHHLFWQVKREMIQLTDTYSDVSTDFRRSVLPHNQSGQTSKISAI